MWMHCICSYCLFYSRQNTKANCITEMRVGLKPSEEPICSFDHNSVNLS